MNDIRAYNIDSVLNTVPLKAFADQSMYNFFDTCSFCQILFFLSRPWVALMVKRRTHNRKVVGLNPASSS